MDAEIEELAQYMVHKLDHTASPNRILVGIAGIPASGKSTFTNLLTARVNRILDDLILIGLDGWHLSRAQLDVFPDPQAAHDRRGSHWTFDGAGYVAFLRQLRDTTITDVITAPSFDHALKDPTPVSIYPYHRIVIIEGLYVFLAIHPWSDGGFMLDERWFIEVDPAVARTRLIGRHVLTGVAKDMKEAEWRADENDGPSGQFVITNMLEPTRVIQSIETPGLSKPTMEHVESAPIYQHVHA
ncbi:P-loop containing nucleoside triphosphate hydrolase protein [Flammula alnicola]|nr:P-loop containing nucleoside triphosphate hydrolase protein [Flammula alnicola]